MTASCGFKCAKATLFTVNFIFWVAALAVLAAGIWMRVSPDFLEQQGVAKLESDAISLSSGGLILIAVAAVGVILGFFGCCGTAKESQCMLGIYVTFLLIILFVQLVAAVCGILALTVFRDAFEEKILNSMKTNLQNKFGEDDAKDVTDMWNITQFEANCCGASGPEDYKNSTWYTRQNEETRKINTVPLSCCSTYENKTTKNPERCQEEARNATLRNGALNQQGCYGAIKQAMRTYSKILIATSIGVSLVELFCFILGVFLCCNVGKYSYDYE